MKGVSARWVLLAGLAGGACVGGCEVLEARETAIASPALGLSHENDEHMEWWREARFGMFVHFGLYSIPAGEWDSATGHGEWIRETAQIPLPVYDQLVHEFNPTAFDADAWVRAAKDAGMRYIVVTTKHHDGFALFDSAVSDFDVMATPFRRDIMRELADACARHGLRIGWYHSIMDWHHPDYLPRRAWETDRPTDGADLDRYVRFLRAQVRELLTKYGPIGVMWFDGEWEPTWTHERGVALYELCRAIQPDVIVNNRVDVHRQGMAGLSASGTGAVGDFGTPEQEVPDAGLPGVDWETCMTIRAHWGHNKADMNAKSGRELVRTLVDVASKGGNFLLNVGPTASGAIAPIEAERLASIGRWMSVHGEAIYGTGASVLPDTPWGRCTAKREGGRTTLYLHVFDWPADGRLVADGVGSMPTRVSLLGAPQAPSIEHGLIPEGLALQLPSGPTDADVSVIKVEFDGEPTINHPPTFQSRGTEFVDTMAVSLSTRTPGAVIRYARDGNDPTAASLPYAGPITVRDTTQIRAAVFRGGERVSRVVTGRFTKVEPWSATLFVRAPDPGLLLETFPGDFDRLPDFAGLTPESSEVVASPALPDETPPRERVARRYSGVIGIDRTAMHTFSLTSDDGARLIIDDRVVIDNDGLHVAAEKRASVPLQAGYHRVVIEWFNRTGDAALSLRREVGGELREIPVEAWGH